MVFRPIPLAFVATFCSAVAFAQTSSTQPSSTQTSTAMLDGTKVSQPAIEPPKTPLSPEMRGDILMARKMYREAIEAFSQGSAKDAVLKNKRGIAFHQLLQLEHA